MNMNASSLWKRRSRHGLSMTEMILTVMLTSAAMVGGAKLMAVAHQQGRLVDQRRLAGVEASNILEQVMAQPWQQITPGEQSAFGLSDAGRQLLPDAKVRVVVDPEPAQPEARRITVAIDWQVAAQRRGRPVRLVAWQYLNTEAQP
jgi:hypothetical protein